MRVTFTVFVFAIVHILYPGNPFTLGLQFICVALSVPQDVFDIYINFKKITEEKGESC